MLKKYFDSIENKRKEQRRRERARSRSRAIAAFTFGSLISAASALLFAPKSGKELRKDIADKTAEGAELVKKNAVRSYEKASKFAGDLYQNAKSALKKEKQDEEQTAEAGDEAKK